MPTNATYDKPARAKKAREAFFYRRCEQTFYTPPSARKRIEQARQRAVAWAEAISEQLSLA